MPVRGAVVQRLHFLLRLRETVCQERAKIRERAAREEKGEDERLALELCGADRLAEFVGEMIIRQRVAHVQRLAVLEDDERTRGRDVAAADLHDAGLDDVVNPAFLGVTTS